MLSKNSKLISYLYTLAEYIPLFIFFAFIFGVIMFLKWDTRRVKEQNTKALSYSHLSDKVWFLLDVMEQPYPIFQPDRKLMSLLNKQINLETNIRTLTSAILSHMGLSATNLDLMIAYSPFSKYENSNWVGRFQQFNYLYNEMEIMVKPDYTGSTIAAILCHECAHFFMAQKNIHAPEKEQEEILTDIMTAFLGFGNIMQDGYQVCTSETHQSNNLVITRYSKVGYICRADIISLKKIIKKQARKHAKASAKKRQKKAEFQSRKETFLKEKERLKDNLLAARTLYDGLLFLADSAQTNSNLFTTPEDLSQIQEIFLAIEQKIIYFELEKSEKDLAACNTKDLLDLETQRIEILCTRLSEWTTFLGRH